ncbi:hypothetical protein WA026_023559 [Henosepilachna vigintioctopunctata]|uniref:Uncharacterized protein n=1 Tax=Henosepilachna vigintioctopunctata TaxID=420089 RepID=A0AAW1UK42_9CUCU
MIDVEKSGVGLMMRNCKFCFRSGLRQDGRNREFFSGSAPTTSHPHITISRWYLFADFSPEKGDASVSDRAAYPGGGRCVCSGAGGTCNREGKLLKNLVLSSPSASIRLCRAWYGGG